MTLEELAQVQRDTTMGFEYCFLHYSDFEEIADPAFHELRLNYINAQKKLYDYLRLDEYEENDEDYIEYGDEYGDMEDQ